MAFPPIRARIAPIALLVAFTFVVAGFLRADGEMTRAEEDRAALVASQAAALVELFLLRRELELRVLQQAVESAYAKGGTTLPKQGMIPTGPPDIASSFDALVVTDSMFNVVESIALHRRAIAPPVGSSVSVTPIHSSVQEHSGRSVVLIDRQTIPPAMLLLVPIRTSRHATLVGLVSTDSLEALLRRQQMPKGFESVIRAGGDTVISLVSREPDKHTRRVQRLIDTPYGPPWSITMIYAPSGRGVRIALWVVGLGAIVGLGIGLLLERREASRIADRSSELEHLSTELLRANRAKSEFLANVSHELRTPLNAIVGFVDLLRDGVYGTLNSRQVGPVERIEASATHLRHLVDQVLDLAKMAAGRLEVHSEPVELRPFVFDVASEVEPLITEKGLSFSLAVGASLPRVRTDPTHLRQILINLLGNAVKFTSNGGISVRGKLVSTEEPPGAPQSVTPGKAPIARALNQGGFWVALQVADSGVGIPDKDRERIFDEFEQVDAGPRGDSMRRGTGLGLSISRRLARLLGGDITVESELGRGSVFTIWLPVDPADLRGDQAA